MATKEMAWGKRLAHNGNVLTRATPTYTEYIFSFLDKKVRDKTIAVLEAFLSKQVRA